MCHGDSKEPEPDRKADTVQLSSQATALMPHAPCMEAPQQPCKPPAALHSYSSPSTLDTSLTEDPLNPNWRSVQWPCKLQSWKLAHKQAVCTAAVIMRHAAMPRHAPVCDPVGCGCPLPLPRFRLCQRNSQAPAWHGNMDVIVKIFLPRFQSLMHPVYGEQAHTTVSVQLPGCNCVSPP